MKYQIVGKKKDIALITNGQIVIADATSAMDMMASVQCETGCEKIIIGKSCISEDFFVLSTGVAGEILQKFVTYHKKIAIVGDYTKYTSKPLKDFIYESNRGNSIYFFPKVEEAILALER